MEEADKRRFKQRFNKMTDDEIIDMFLTNETFDYKPNADDEYNFKSFISMIADNQINALFEQEGLLVVEKEDLVTKYSYTNKANEIVRNGGWKKYLKETADERSRKVNLEQSVINSNKIQKVATFLTLFIIIVNCFVDYSSYQIARNEELQKKESILEKDYLRLNREVIRLEKENTELKIRIEQENSGEKKISVKSPSKLP